ncbi:GNAT family N-acetyltransferase [Kitasatospora sp. NPDC051170]|uniref:GNAT family N-acetyltransferase n=1 Tax=Kitasatospora sp. NPDC051170 TaxID=3364056 RepID=UPI0037AB980F
MQLLTERLRLRPLTVADTDWWVRLHADTRVNEFVGNYTAETAAARLRAIEESWAQRGYGLFAVESRATGEAVGRCGISWYEPFGEAEAGWTLAAEHWGHGYATEAAQALLTWADESLDLPRLIALIRAANTGSIAVARRLGFRPLREDTFFGGPGLVYARDRAAARE